MAKKSQKPKPWLETLRLRRCAIFTLSDDFDDLYALNLDRRVMRIHRRWQAVDADEVARALRRFVRYSALYPILGIGTRRGATPARFIGFFAPQLHGQRAPTSKSATGCCAMRGD